MTADRVTVKRITFKTHSYIEQDDPGDMDDPNVGLCRVAVIDWNTREFGMPPSSKAAMCQCPWCLKYLETNRAPGAPYAQSACTGCGGNLKLAEIRGTLTRASDLEMLALIAEECGEVTQRIGKIVRWGWDATFEGTTQQAKLESELGDILAAVVLAGHNGHVVFQKIIDAANVKLQKFREDAAGPRQRLLHAEVPPDDVEDVLDRVL